MYHACVVHPFLMSEFVDLLFQSTFPSRCADPVVVIGHVAAPGLGSPTWIQPEQQAPDLPASPEEGAFQKQWKCKRKNVKQV